MHFLIDVVCLAAVCMPALVILAAERLFGRAAAVIATGLQGKNAGSRYLNACDADPITLLGFPSRACTQTRN